MKEFARNIGIMAMMAVVAASCSKGTDLYEGPKPAPEPQPNQTSVGVEPQPIANTFDFSTINKVQVSIDYSASGVGSVYFQIYDQNPYAGAASEDAAAQLKDELLPLFGGFTDTNGRFSKELELPAYATHLYITTGNMFVGCQLMEADVQAGRATASMPSKARTRAASTNYALADGKKGYNVPENLWKQWVNGQFVEIGAAEWATPLGRFDLHTGRPNYIISGNDLAEAESKGLVFTADEMKGLFEAVGNAVSVDTRCPDYLRVNYDLELARESELAITLVGSFTGWNNSLGYYIYEGEAPKSLADVQVIMLFPNTQDGCWYKTDGNGKISVPRDDVEYHGAIALNRGDAVQLYYYPNHKKGSFSPAGATKLFPAGTKIGFVLKNNGWGCQGTDYAVRKNGNVFHNWWASSTKGLSYTADGDAADKTKLGDAPRTCKFQYKDFVVLGFEDYGDDENFSDLAFAIRPAEAFQPLPQLESKETTQQMGVYGFEDLWPAKGDYDMNDVLVDYKYIKTQEKFDNESDDAYKTKSETLSFTTYQNYAALHSGLAVRINFAGTPENVVVSKGKNGQFETIPTVIQDGNIYVLTEDINVEIGTEYRVTATYSTGITRQSEVEPFIFRWNTDMVQRLEVHLPFKAPSSLVDPVYFHTDNDLSDPDQGIYYVREGNYPYAFFLAGGNIDWFRDTLLNFDYERKPIETIYPKFLDWSVSGGTVNTDWYRTK